MTPCRPWFLLAVLLVTLPLAAGEAVSPGKPVAPLAIDKPLVAHWTFDEAFGEACQEASGNGPEATPARPAS